MERIILLYMIIRVLTAAVAVIVSSGCRESPASGPPARLVAGSDTLVVNSRKPFQIPMRVLDASGHDLPVTALRYESTAGDSIQIASTGAVTCTQRADATLRASLANLTTTVLLRCRPVESVHIPGPIQLSVGDSAQPIPVEALGTDGERVDLLAGTADVTDSSVVTLDRLSVRPRSPGATLASVRIGERSAAVGVHVYERVTTLDGLSPAQTMVSIRLRLVRGEFRRWRLPAGVWMLTMLPYEDEARGLRLRVEDANCLPATITARRIVCLGKNHVSVFVYHPLGQETAGLTGELLVRRVED